MLQQTYLMLCLFTFALSPGKASDAVLDEIIAGCDANLALIDRGFARYEITTTRTDPTKLGEPPLKKNERPMFQGTQHVRTDFDRSRCRWIVGRIRCYRDDKHDVFFDARKLKEGQEKKVPIRKAVNYTVTINAIHTSFFIPTPYHPRYIGHGIGDRENDKTIADLLRVVRNRPDESISVTHEGELLRATNKMRIPGVYNI